MTVALVCSASGLERDPDLELAVKAFAELGVDCVLTRWDDPHENWDRYDISVVRSCWDYTWRSEEFLSWADSTPRLNNPSSMLRWSSDKRYLQDLAAAGCPVVPTVWNPQNTAALPPATEWVVKPAVSAGSRNTARWGVAEDALRHADELRTAGATAMVQPYLTSVDDQGETALLFLGGRFSHAVRKGPLLKRGEGVRHDRNSRADLRPVRATPEQRAVAEQALDAASAKNGLADRPLYARVDLVAGVAGPLVLELELVEPSLFLPQAVHAATRFARAVMTLIEVELKDRAL